MMVLAERIKGLVLSAAGIWLVVSGKVDDWVVLITVHLHPLIVEAERSIFELSKLEGEVFVKASGVDDVVRHRVPFFLVFEVIHAGFDVDFFQKVLNPLGITADWKSLPGVVEIIVVVLKSERQAFDDAGRKLFAISAPLLLGVAFDELLIDRAANKFDGLLFEVLWFTDVFLLNLFGDFGFCLFRGGDTP